MFTMEFTHKHLIGPKEQIPAMNRVKKILNEGNFSGTVFPFSKGIITIFSTISTNGDQLKSFIHSFLLKWQIEY